jgi:hypothetical protein
MQVIEEVVNNRNAVTCVGVQCAARAFSDLIKRYKGAAGGGLVPKTFVTDFLWEASPQEYAEAKIKEFLSEDAFDIWKAVRKHMVQVSAASKACQQLVKHVSI